MIRNAIIVVYLAIVLFFVLFAVCFHVDAGIFPYNNQAFPAWGWQLDKPSLYFDIQRYRVFKIARIDIKDNGLIVYTFWDKAR
jgi:hypothetical protein